MFIVSLVCLISLIFGLFLPIIPAVSLEARAKLRARDTTDSESPCAQIFNSEFNLFTAEFAYECLKSVPFNATVATQFVGYYRDTLQFQSTLAYLKNPPPSYQQPATDLLAGLESIENDIKSGVFKNEYDFEASLQRLIYSAHDAHLVLYAGALAVFTFGSPLRIVSVSEDGIALPKIYDTDDLIESQYAENVDWKPSAIVSINGIETTKYLMDFAAVNSQGTLEAHADWNQVMSSAAGDIQGFYSVFEGSTPFYPGAEIDFAFENGTSTGPLPWLATYEAPADTPLISSGEDFYTFFVLGLYPADSASTDDTTPTSGSDSTSTVDTSSETDSASATSPTATESSDNAAATSDSSTPSASASSLPSWEYFPYPSDPSVVQPDLGSANGGVITGYLLNDDTTAVLSIPSFDVNGEAIVSFSTTIAEFIQKAKDGGYTRIIIDVQNNGGKGHLLAEDTFKQFFPSISTFDGSRLRAHDTADTIGTTFTTYFNTQHLNETYFDALSANIWVATDYLNAETGQNFTSWPEFFGPHRYNGDDFTTTQRYNYSNVLFDEEASGGIVVSGFGNRSAATPQPFAAENIIILSDSLCYSACASFVEMMHNEAGVRTVVAGGLPQTGPMQIPGGSRGAEAYSLFDLDDEIAVARAMNSSVDKLLPNRDFDFYVTYGAINIKDAVREGSSTPLQFTYEAADCRIFYTPRTVYNYLNLWNYVVDAMWRNPSLCIVDSTNQISSTNVTDTNGPSSTEKEAWKNGQSLSTLIMRGFAQINKPPSNVGKRSLKESTPAKRRRRTPERSETLTKRSGISPKRHILVKDDLVDPSVCDRCGRGKVCPLIPVCALAGGPVQSRNECKRACSRKFPDCGHGSQCFLSFCETPRVIKTIKTCTDRQNAITPKDLEEHPPLGFHIPHLPYARNQFGGGSSRGSGGYSPKPIRSG